MFAEMKSGGLVEIDTSCLFKDQYNTVDGKRIFDGQIKRILDDVRGNYGKCRYCGAIVKRGEEEKHFTEKEKQTCDKCFWNCEKIQNREKSSKTVDNDGERKTVITIVETYCKACSFTSFGSRKTDCTNTECRAYGIDWFTSENTFFLRYPNGFESMTELDKMPARGFCNIHPLNWNPGITEGEYIKKLGSYFLSFSAETDTGAIRYYEIRNCRRHYKFKFSENRLFVFDTKFGWKERKSLSGVIPSVMEAVNKICNN